MADVPPITSLEDLLNRVEERLIPEGSTVRVSNERPDLQTPLQLNEVNDVLTAYRVKLNREAGLDKNAIIVELPPAKAKPSF
jgi:UPF0288 family protein (methanogenesis marker protein 3)